MGFRKYRGPVQTVEQASLADLPIRVTCQQCGHFRQMHAHKLIRLSEVTRALRLGEPVRGFKCQHCRHPVLVVIAAPVGSV